VTEVEVLLQGGQPAAEAKADKAPVGQGQASRDSYCQSEECWQEWQTRAKACIEELRTVLAFGLVGDFLPSLASQPIAALRQANDRLRAEPSAPTPSTLDQRTDKAVRSYQSVSLQGVIFERHLAEHKAVSNPDAFTRFKIDVYEKELEALANNRAVAQVELEELMAEKLAGSEVQGTVTYEAGSGSIAFGWSLAP